MRILGILVAAALSAVPVIGQQKPEGGVTAPKKGDIAFIRGCNAWPLLVQAGLAKPEITGHAGTAYTYRLSGDKNLVKPLQKEHLHTIVEVTGVLRAPATPPPAPRSKEFGKTRVYVGSSGSAPTPPEYVEPPLLLRVTAFQPTGIRCSP